LIVFAVNKYVLTAQMASLGDLSQAVSVAAPILASILVYCLMGLIRPWRNEESDALVDSLSVDAPEDDVDEQTIAAGVRA
jgi:SSS family solute:Na+ symporter